MIDLNLMRQSLRISFGDVLACDPGFAEGAASLLHRYSLYRDYAALSRRMEDFLFNALYDRLGPGMALPNTNGGSHRFLVSDLPEAADEALFPLFFCLPPEKENYSALHDYWLSSGSFSAMRTLYLHFSDQLPAAEKAMMERIIFENIPSFRREEWLHPDISDTTPSPRSSRR